MRVLAGAQRFLERKAPDAQSWFIYVPSAAMPGANVSWLPQTGKDGARPRRRDNQALIDAHGEAGIARETRGGEFFYRFHFDLYYMPVIWARWLVGIAAMMMLVAILTGIITHKRIFRDFFALRRGKGTRSWLDGHNATAVLALPFHLMITYTGLVTLMVTLLPWVTSASFTDGGKYYDSLYPTAPSVERSGRPAPLMDLAVLLRDAERRLGGPVGYIDIDNPGDAAARVTILRATRSMLSSHVPRITYDGVSGAMLWRSPPQGAASETAGVMIGLHAGRFADDWLRLLYFLCGVAGSVMVASGLVMWTVKRRTRLPDPANPHFGFRLVERLNVAAIGGFPLGIAVMLWANRLLPAGMAGRGDWEIHALFLAWGAALLLAMVRRPAPNWVAMFGSTGVLLAALPIYNLVATPSGLAATLASGDWTLAGIDIALLMFGTASLALTRRIARRGNVHKGAGQRVSARPAMMAEPAE
jgi:hypothetical protein